MKRLFTVLSLTLLVAAAQADSFTILELRHRPAEEVIPVIQPMLGADDVISGEGYKIFLRSSPATVARVRGMVDVLDTPAKILQVSVFQGSERDLRALAARANVQIDTGDVSVDIGRESDNDDGGGSITYGTAGGSASVAGIETQTRLRDGPIHRVRVIEGSEAYIETGERIPYFYGAAWIGPRGVAGGVEYRDAVTGFYVLPRVRGENVMLEVSPFKSSRSHTGGDEINTQSASTTITGRAGEWLMIGGITEQVEQAQGTTGARIATQSKGNTGTWIKADLVQ